MRGVGTPLAHGLLLRRSKSRSQCRTREAFRARYSSPIESMSASSGATFIISNHPSPLNVQANESLTLPRGGIQEPESNAYKTSASILTPDFCLLTPSSSLLLLVDVDKLRVDHIVLLLGAGAIRRRTSAVSLRSATRRSRTRLVHRLSQLVARLRQTVDRFVDLIYTAAGHGLPRRLERGFHCLGIVVADLVAMVLQHLLDLVDHRIGAIARVDFILALVVLGCVGLGVLGHLL